LGYFQEIGLLRSGDTAAAGGRVLHSHYDCATGEVAKRAIRRRVEAGKLLERLGLGKLTSFCKTRER